MDFPKCGVNLSAIKDLHGGGQQASKSEVLYWNSQGYASLSNNWGGKVVEKPSDLNTDWAGIAAGLLSPKPCAPTPPGSDNMDGGKWAKRKPKAK